MALRKEDKADIRKRYPLYVEIGMIAALVLLIAAFRINYNPGSDVQFVMDEQDVVEIEEIQQTEQEVQPPPPPTPPVPIEVPDDAVLEDTEVDWDATLDFDEPLEQTPPPPPEPEPEPEQEIFMVVEQQPEMIGGMEALYDEIEYPDFARRAGIEGRVFVQFVVDQEGNVTNPTVLRSPHEMLSEEALRVIQMMQFTPGMQRGEAVLVRMSIPITFELR